MEKTVKLLKALGSMALVMVAVGCASTQNKSNAVAAAGFHAITPSTSTQEAKLSALPADRFTTVVMNGMTYYVHPDAPNNRAFVGGPKQYQAYEAQHPEEPAIAENVAHPVTSLDLPTWHGWGASSWYY